MAMKHFGWNPSFIWEMTYDNFILFLATIPDYSSDDDKKETGSSSTSNAGDHVEYVNLFDFGS